MQMTVLRLSPHGQQLIVYEGGLGLLAFNAFKLWSEFDQDQVQQPNNR